MPTAYIQHSKQKGEDTCGNSGFLVLCCLVLRQGLVLPKADLRLPTSCLSPLITGASHYTWLSLNIFKRKGVRGRSEPLSLSAVALKIEITSKMKHESIVFCFLFLVHEFLVQG